MEEYLAKVRLEPFQCESIIDAFKSCFLIEDSLWIFGSRVNLQARGGDIDLYIETNVTSVDDVYKRESKFIDLVWQKIGEQKIDVVLNLLNLQSQKLPIYDIARNEGVKLV